MSVYSIKMAPSASRTEHMPDGMRKWYASIWLEKHYAADVKHSTQAHLGQASFICLWSEK